MALLCYSVGISKLVRFLYLLSLRRKALQMQSLATNLKLKYCNAAPMLIIRALGVLIIRALGVLIIRALGVLLVCRYCSTSGIAIRQRV